MDSPGDRSPTAASPARASLGPGEVVFDDWLTLRRYGVAVPREDGSVRRLTRLDVRRADRVCVLPFDPRRATVLLTRQLRLPALLHGAPGGVLTEAPGGLVEDSDAEKSALREVEEETGYRLTRLEHLVTVYPAPQLSSERAHLFTGEYDVRRRIHAGGGIEQEGERIEVVELGLDEAVAAVSADRFADGRTLLLLLLAQRRLRVADRAG